MPVSTDPSKRSRVNTRARLVEAARDVVADVGLDAATIDQICTAAGFTRGAFYSSFDSREELIFAVWRSYVRSIVDDLSAVVAHLDEVTEDVDATIDDLVLQVTSNRHAFMFGTELMLYCLRHEDAAVVYADHRRELRAGLTAAVSTVWERRGLHRPAAEAAWCARQLLAAVEGVQRQTWLEPEELGDGALQIGMVRSLLA